MVAFIPAKGPAMPWSRLSDSTYVEILGRDRVAHLKTTSTRKSEPSLGRGSTIGRQAASILGTAPKGYRRRP